jgi:pectinesterase
MLPTNSPVILRGALKMGVAAIAFLMIGGAALAEDKIITVSADGSGNFKTLQEGIAAAPEKSPSRTIIHIKPGTYEGPFLIPKAKAMITLQGDGADKTILTCPLTVYDPIPAGGHKSNAALYVAGDDFHAEELTIQNTAGDRGQALAMRVEADRGIFKNCRFLGWQDTTMFNTGRHYIKDCYIEGRVDFIYGGGTAVFDRCTLHSKNGGYVTAASTPAEHPYGFVFIQCKLTGDPTPWVNPTAGAEAPKPSQKTQAPQASLGRPWRPYANVIFLHCEMGGHIRPEGWYNWGKAENEQTARYAEYGNTGPGADLEKRVKWAKTLGKEEADKITVESVLAGSDNWKPN